MWAVVAFGKLQGILNSAPKALPKKNVWNGLLMVLNAWALSRFASASTSMALGLKLLGLGTLTSAFLGAHVTSSIGGADMPVVITSLNSASGWARPRLRSGAPRCGSGASSRRGAAVAPTPEKPRRPRETR